MVRDVSAGTAYICFVIVFRPPKLSQRLIVLTVIVSIKPPCSDLVVLNPNGFSKRRNAHKMSMFRQFSHRNSKTKYFFKMENKGWAGAGRSSILWNALIIQHSKLMLSARGSDGPAANGNLRSHNSRQFFQMLLLQKSRTWLSVCNYANR